MGKELVYEWDCERIGCEAVIITPYDDLLAGILLTKAGWSYDARDGNLLCPKHNKGRRSR